MIFKISGFFKTPVYMVKKGLWIFKESPKTQKWRAMSLTMILEKLSERYCPSLYTAIYNNITVLVVFYNLLRPFFFFRIYDIDNDGFISNGELFQVMKMISGTNLKEDQLQQVVDKSIIMFDKVLFR